MISNLRPFDNCLSPTALDLDAVPTREMIADRLAKVRAGFWYSNLPIDVTGAEALLALALRAHDLSDMLASLPAATGSKVLQDVAAERVRQDALWGGPEHDDKHLVSDWRSFIDHQMDQFPQLASTRNVTKSRPLLIKIAALAVAAVESIDRKLEVRKRLYGGGT